MSVKPERRTEQKGGFHIRSGQSSHQGGTHFVILDLLPIIVVFLNRVNAFSTLFLFVSSVTIFTHHGVILDKSICSVEVIAYCMLADIILVLFKIVAL